MVNNYEKVSYNVIFLKIVFVENLVVLIIEFKK